MLVDKAQAAQGSATGRTTDAERATGAARQVSRAIIPSNLDRDLPGRRVAHGFNIGLTPVLFAAIGYGIDRVAGTVPIFTIALAVLSIVGLFASFWYSYKATIEAEAAEAATRAKGRSRR